MMYYFVDFYTEFRNTVEYSATDTIEADYLIFNLQDMDYIKDIEG